MLAFFSFPVVVFYLSFCFPPASLPWETRIALRCAACSNPAVEVNDCARPAMSMRAGFGGCFFFSSGFRREGFGGVFCLIALVCVVRSWGHLGPHEDLLGPHLGAILGPTRTILGPSLGPHENLHFFQRVHTKTSIFSPHVDFSEFCSEGCPCDYYCLPPNWFIIVSPRRVFENWFLVVQSFTV